MDAKAVIMKIYGRVQGVGFRYYAQKKAQEQEISGFVNNQSNGSVYIEAEGKAENMEVFIQWCEMGPSWARISHVEKQWIPLQGYRDFQIR